MTHSFKPQKLRFATAGIPISTQPRNTLNAMPQLKSLGLEGMEIEFVQSVNIGEKLAPQVKQAAIDNDILLTCHGQYFINLNSKEPEKIEASKQRILKAATRANECGVWSLVFHAAFYMKMDKPIVYNNVKTQMKQLVKEIQDLGNPIWIRPETTGKGTQFGDVDELIKLSQDVEQVLPCVDFSHLHARSNGAYNTTEEFQQVLEKMETGLGRTALDNMHIHVSGIAYGEKGEKHHLILEESDMNYPDLMKVFKDFNLKGQVVCESPNIESDALLFAKNV